MRRFRKKVGTPLKDGYFWYLSQISGVKKMWKSGTLRYLRYPRPQTYFQSWIPTQCHIHFFMRIQLGSAGSDKKVCKKIGITSLKCFVTSHMMSFGPKKQYRTFDQMPAFIESWSEFIRNQMRVQTTKRGIPQKLFFFSCKSSFFPQRLEDFCSKTETQNGHLQIPSNSDI